MQQTGEQAGNFLQSIFQHLELKLRVSVQETPNECVLDVDGPDADLLQAESGELLEALQHLMNQAFRRMLPTNQRLVCDVHGFRATREAELRAMAQLAAERVRASGVAFMFGPMNANERRIIHLTLAESQDLYTESIGEGSERKLKVGLKNRA
jgi:spoIIIJ-associated protein